MCIVIDANTLAPVFNDRCDLHSDFKLIKKWIFDGNGFLIFGGTKYKNELKKAYRYLKLIRRLKDIHKAIEVCQRMVDMKEKDIITQTKGTSCNDQHIIAIFCVSKCILYCSKDSSSDVYIKDQKYYQKGHKRPKIYRSSKNSNLINDRNIVKIYNAI